MKRKSDGKPNRKPGSEYYHYIHSEEWAKKRSLVHEFWGGRCAICYSAYNVQVHHRTYDRLGNELLSDLIPLCQECHSLFHNRFQKNDDRTESDFDLETRSILSSIFSELRG